MKKSNTYRFIASVLSLCILIGVSVPSGLHAKALLACNNMSATMHLEHEMGMDMEHTEAHDFGLVCACSVEEAPLKTEAQGFLKVKIAPSSELIKVAEAPSSLSESDKYALQIADSYSLLPLFVTHESFLI